MELPGVSSGGIYREKFLPVVQEKLRKDCYNTPALSNIKTNCPEIIEVDHPGANAKKTPASSYQNAGDP